MNKNKTQRRKYGIYFDYVEYRLLRLRLDINNIMGELDNYESIPLEHRRTMHELNSRYKNIKNFIDALNEIKMEVNQETVDLIDLLYLKNMPFENVSDLTNIKLDKLMFRHKVLVDEVMERMFLYTGPKRRYFNNKRRREIPKSVIKQVKERDKNQCTRCDRKDNLHLHHIVRYAEGGQDTVDNLILLCVECHAEEHKGERAYHILRSQAEKVIT